MLARLKLVFLIGLAVLAFAVPNAAAATRQTVFVAEVNGVINPAAADYISRAISDAELRGGQALVLLLNTPGGLAPSTWEIAESILNARIPVVVYVAPQGAGAGSAGVYIAYAAPLAAMAPNTNIGAAHPVAGGGEDIGGDLRDKVTNDAVARITNWARSNGRNAEWAEEAVRKSVSIGSQEALEKNVVNIVANDMADLLTQLDGRQVRLSHGSVTLATAGAPTERIDMSFVERLLHHVADPTIAYLLISIGSLALFFELSHPGLTVAGLLGTVANQLGLYGANVLPVNYVGLALLLFSFILFGIDLFATNHGALTIGGLVAFVTGSLMLFNSADAPGVQVSRWVITGMTTSLLLIVVFLGFLVARNRGTPIQSGVQKLLGQPAHVRMPLTPEGSVFIDGALWRARAVEPVAEAEYVQVVGIQGLTLLVRPLPDTGSVAEERIPPVAMKGTREL